MNMLDKIRTTVGQYNARLVAVSKTKSVEQIREIYDQGVRVFGENRARELEQKHPLLPSDIQWHMIGHLQNNKVKYIASFVEYIHSIDSYKLLKEVQKQAAKHNRIIKVLLQIRIAREEAKYGLTKVNASEVVERFLQDLMPNIQICGVMGMATFTSDKEIVSTEFENLKNIFDYLKAEYYSEDDTFYEISMGMSGDYELALEKGSTMVRVGSLIFGPRQQ